MLLLALQSWYVRLEWMGGGRLMECFPHILNIMQLPYTQQNILQICDQNLYTIRQHTLTEPDIAWVAK